MAGKGASPQFIFTDKPIRRSRQKVEGMCQASGLKIAHNLGQGDDALFDAFIEFIFARTLKAYLDGSLLGVIRHRSPGLTDFIGDAFWHDL
jgi:hypothetical protein